MRQSLAFATALAAILLIVTLTGCGSKGPLTRPLPQQQPLAVPATAPVGDVNTDAKTGVDPQVSNRANTPPNPTEDPVK
jgi:predicted small lipoprotein YifL